MTRKRIAATALIGAGVLTATVALARPAYWVEYTYYADASYGTVVGQRGFDCNARSYGFGQESEFAVETRNEWCGSGPAPD